MIILGLGSNLGHRLQHLRRAVQLIRCLPDVRVCTVSPVYASDALVPDNASSDWLLPFFNIAVGIETNLTPDALLPQLKKIESRMGRLATTRWAPRLIDIDILAWDDLQYVSDALTIPHVGLEHRPFALWPLLDITPEWHHPVWKKAAKDIAQAWGSRFTQSAPFHTHQLTMRLSHTQLIGIINVTPDSFSDGGIADSLDKALTQAARLVEEGATVLDIGAESTRPGAMSITSDEEWSRLSPVLCAIRQAYPDIVLSVDTRHAFVAKQSIACGVQWINDVSGFRDKAMIDAVASSNVDIVIMHSLSIPEDRTVRLTCDEDPIDTVFTFAKERIATLENAGITRDRIIFDVGIGYGKTAEQSVLLIQHIDVFHSLGVRLLVGHSRKSFFSLITDLPAKERDIETCVTSCYLAQNHVHYLRVHNIEMNRRALAVEGMLQQIR